MPRLKFERIQILFIYKRMGLSHTMYLRPQQHVFSRRNLYLFPSILPYRKELVPTTSS